MGTPAGLAAQLAFAEEVTYGTFIAPTRFFEFTDEDVKFEIARLESQGLRAGRRLQHQWAAGAKMASGSIGLEIPNVGFGLILKHLLGGAAVAGPASGAFTHTFTPGDLTGKSLTTQFGRPRNDATVEDFTYVGTKISSAEIACKAGEIATAKLNIFAQDEDQTRTLATPSYPTGIVPFTFVGGVLSIAGSGVDVAEADLTIDNALTGARHRLKSGAALSKEPLENGRREVTGSCVADFDNLTAYNRFVTGTEAALVLTFTGQGAAIPGGSTPYSLQITLNVRFDGDTPNVSGAEVLTQPLTFKALSGTSDAAAITAVYVTSDATP